MAKFIFRLENILQIKCKFEEQRKIEFGIAMERLYAARQLLEEMYIRKERYESTLRQLVSKGAKAIDIREVSGSIEVIKSNIEEQRRQVAIEERNAEAARENLNIAMQERKTYEKLKENEFEKFKKEVNAQEMKEVDEFVSYKYAPTTAQAVEE